MRLLCLGSGSAFTTGEGNWQSNFLLETASGHRLLIDCGSDARLSLAEQGLAAADIDAVYVSHLHSDHIGGLEWLAFSTYFDDDCPRPRLFIHDDMVDDLWHHALRAGLEGTQAGPVRLDSYFDVTALGAGGGFAWQRCRFETIPVMHIGHQTHTFPAYGLGFALNGKRVFLTTDTKFSPGRLMKDYMAADIILHDCETAPIPSEVHAHYRDLIGLPADIRRRMWLYHYQPGARPDAVADGFAGFVAPGQEFA